MENCKYYKACGSEENCMRCKGKEMEKNMVEINTEPKVTEGKFVIEYQRDGYGACTPVINGTPAKMLTFGYVSESDYDSCVQLIKKAVNATDGDVCQAAQYIRTAMEMTANDIIVSETTEIEGIEFMISYEELAIYYKTTEVANLDDLEENVPRSVAKAMLTDRAKLWLSEMETADWLEDDDYYDYD